MSKKFFRNFFSFKLLNMIQSIRVRSFVKNNNHEIYKIHRATPHGRPFHFDQYLLKGLNDNSENGRRANFDHKIFLVIIEILSSNWEHINFEWHLFGNNEKISGFCGFLSFTVAFFKKSTTSWKWLINYFWNFISKVYKFTWKITGGILS